MTLDRVTYEIICEEVQRVLLDEAIEAPTAAGRIKDLYRGIRYDMPAAEEEDDDDDDGGDDGPTPPPDPAEECPPGEIWDPELEKCVPIEEPPDDDCIGLNALKTEICRYIKKEQRGGDNYMPDDINLRDVEKEPDIICQDVIDFLLADFKTKKINLTESLLLEKVSKKIRDKLITTHGLTPGNVIKLKRGKYYYSMNQSGDIKAWGDEKRAKEHSQIKTGEVIPSKAEKTWGERVQEAWDNYEVNNGYVWLEKSVEEDIRNRFLELRKTYVEVLLLGVKVQVPEVGEGLPDWQQLEKKLPEGRWTRLTDPDLFEKVIEFYEACVELRDDIKKIGEKHYIDVMRPAWAEFVEHFKTKHPRKGVGNKWTGVPNRAFEGKFMTSWRWQAPRIKVPGGMTATEPEDWIGFIAVCEDCGTNNVYSTLRHWIGKIRKGVYRAEDPEDIILKDRIANAKEARKSVPEIKDDVIDLSTYIWHAFMRQRVDFREKMFQEQGSQEKLVSHISALISPCLDKEPYKGKFQIVEQIVYEELKKEEKKLKWLL